MSVSGINFSGLSSGIDTESIIQKLLQLEQRPVQIIQNSQKKLLERETAYKTVTAQLFSVQAAAQSLNRLRAFDIVTANSSDETAVSVSAATGAQTGQHTVVVNSLATAQQISTSVQSSQTSPLGFTGQILINGKAIQVNASDSLQSLASTINAAQAGVTASIISPTPNQFYLTLGSKNTGAQGQIALSDTAGGTFLGDTLGIFDAGGATTLPNAIGTTGAASNIFADSGTSVGTLLGLTSPAAGAVTINGQSVSLDLASDSLSAIASKINNAGIPGVTASVVTATDPITGNSGQQLKIDGTQDFEDDNNILANLGVLQRKLASGRELVAGKDASFTLDGLTASRPTNSFSDAISGVTLTLNKGAGASSTVTVSADTDGIKQQIGSFVQAFNDTLNKIDSLSQFDPQTGVTGPLLGDVTAQNIVDSLTAMVTSPVPGRPQALSLLSQVGISLNQQGRLVIDDVQLSRSLVTQNLQDIARLFRSDGIANNAAVQFVSTTGDTKPSGTKGYAIHIDTPGQQATFVAAHAQTSPLAQDEVITFGGPLFGTPATGLLSGGRQVTLKAGSSLADVVSTINGDSVVGKTLSATIENGKLKIVSKQYGSNAQFAILSGVADQGDGKSTGIGSTVISLQGKDVAGTINGEAATGIGQFLTGSLKSNGILPAGKALGLQLLITATQPGDYGSIVVTNGIANQSYNFVSAQTDGYSGALTSAASAVDDTIKDLDDSITTLNARMKNLEQNLREQFLNMEQSVTKIKAASAGLASLSVITTTSK